MTLNVEWKKKSSMLRQRTVQISEGSLPIIILKPAELYVRTTPTILNTTIGSCLAIIMFCPERRISAMSHPLLPHPPAHHPYVSTPLENRRYVIHVVPIMLKKMEALGISPQELEVKIFGGAELLQQDSDNPGSSVGRMNVQAMLDMSVAYNLFVKAFDVGGKQGRKVLLYTHTGEVLVKRVSNIIHAGVD